MCQLRDVGRPPPAMDDWKKRLTRSLSTPRRCSSCQKMVYFSIIRCKHCGNVTHKTCSHHINHRCNISSSGTPGSSCHMIQPDQQIWCSMDRSCDLWSHQPASPTMDQPRLRNSNPGAAMAGLLKIVHWLSHRRRSRELSRTNANADEKHVKGRFGLNPKLEDKEARKRLKALLKNSQNNHHMHFNNGVYVQRCFCGRPVNGNVSNCSICLCRSSRIERSRIGALMTPRGSVSSSECPSPAPQAMANFHAGGSVRQRMPETVSRFSDAQEHERERFGSSTPTKPVLSPQRQNDSCSFLTQQRTQCGGGKNPRYGRPPCISKAKTLSLESRDFTADSLCATWPPAGKTGTTIDEILDESDYGSAEGDPQDGSVRSDCDTAEETLREWCIPFGDIEFEERIRHGRHGDIYKGRWYGEVLIYTIRQSCDTELKQFLDEVAQMGMIRHENIVLFMGACIEPPRLAVITSMRKGPSLFEYLHEKRHRMPFHTKINIARQIAQGMGYLHAKGIAHKKLNSKNIILESRVKLCIMDHGMANKEYDRDGYGCIPRGHLSYISPELISTLHIDPPRIYPANPYTQYSDIYAFGSVLFELLAERFAFHDHHPHVIIWQVASGQRCSLHNFRFISGLKTLIKKCWAQNPQHRPPFSQIVHELQENVSHHKRHSSSEPDRLHYTGQSFSRNICT